MHILLWGAERIGDVVMTFPALKLLRKLRPGCRLTFVTTDYAREILETSGLVDEIVTYAFKRDFVNILLFRRLRKRIKSGEFNHVILLGKVTKFRRKVSKGLDGVTQPVPPDGLHWSEQHMETVKAALGEPDAGLDGFTPEIELADGPDARAALRELSVPLGGPYIVLHAATNRTLRKRNSGKRVAEKLWPPDRQRELLGALRKEWPGMPVLLVGAPAEREFIEREVIGNAADEGIINIAGRTTIPQTLLLLKHARLLICCDSGVMHLGTVVACPLVVLFGPTNEGHTGPFTTRSDVWRVRERPDSREMEDLRVETVLAAVREALGGAV